MGRRGIPSLIISDNFKSFKSVMLKNFLTLKGIKWQFILECSPWWGGFYERLVGVVKNSLKKAIFTSKLTFDELNTVIIEIESVINGRPLTYLNDEPYEHITPNHLIYGRSFSSRSPCKNLEKLNNGDFKKYYKQLQSTINYIKDSFAKGYLTALQEHDSYNMKCRKNLVKNILKIGDVVLIKDIDGPRLS